MASIFGIDITGDGKADFLDDMIMIDIIESSEDSDDDSDDDDIFDD